MELADAPPPNGEEATHHPGYYQDPLSASHLRQWDGSHWTLSTRVMTPADAEPASAYTRSRLILSPPFRFSRTYRVVEEDGRESFHVPRFRWFYRELRVCDREGAEVARLLRSMQSWVLPLETFKVFQGDVEVARLSRFGFQVKQPGAGANTSISTKTGWSASNFTFVSAFRIVARLIPERRFLRRVTYYDLEIAQDVDPVLIVAACIGLMRMSTGGGAGTG